MEDEHLIRMIAVAMLEDPVYASTADAALSVLEQRPGVDAVFTDIDMPGSMDGLALAGRVAERWPRTRLVVTSGWAWFREAEAPNDGQLLPKPYRLPQLLEAISAAA